MSNMAASVVAARDESNNLPPPASGRGERERSKESSSLEVEDGESNNAFFLAAGESNNVLPPSFPVISGRSNKGPMCCDLLNEFNTSRGIVPFSPVSYPLPLPFPFFFLLLPMAWGTALQRTHGSRLASQGRGPRL
jgi:hypothetical protein